ncbi:zinc finger CCHC domain-containing protein 17 isoform X2 [Calonectris borealis]|uniref:zinc finger CCHC domain-containing protein 17 isoform X2 n=1 Tax=Calonectris borealis TaxID=1323832 RepID=UPI003F4BFFB3
MEPLPELYAIFQGEVATVTEYGAFIKIPGCRKQVPRHRSSSSNKSFWTEAWLLEGSGLRRKRARKHELEQQGLVHKTHMSSCRVDKPSEIVDVGDKVWVKLIGKEMKDDKLKLSLSMKVVNQGTGKDLDPNNVSLDQDERKKRMFRDYTSQKITLEAVLNTVCKKCGCKGHFAKECFVQPGGTKYSLIPEEDEEEVAAAGYERDKKTSLADDSSKKRKKCLQFWGSAWVCLRAELSFIHQQPSVLETSLKLRARQGFAALAGGRNLALALALPSRYLN